MSDSEYQQSGLRSWAITLLGLTDDRPSPGLENGEMSQVRDKSNDDARRPLLSLVLPAYNEENSIRSTIRSADSIIDEICDAYEIIVIDDGSDDATLEKLRDIAEDIPSTRIIENEENSGKGYAIRDGCQGAIGEYILVMDADGELSPKQIEAFLERARTTSTDVVIGSKRHPDSDVTYPLKRRILSKGYSKLIRVLFGLQVTDTQVGMKLLSRNAVREVMPLLLVERYAFDIELLALLSKHGFTITEAPVSMDFKSESTIDWSEVVQIGWDTLAVYCRLKLQSYKKIDHGVSYIRESNLMLWEE